MRSENGCLVVGSVWQNSFENFETMYNAQWCILHTIQLVVLRGLANVCRFIACCHGDTLNNGICNHKFKISLLIFHRKGNRFVYPVLDWSKPSKAMVMVVGTTILGFVLHLLFFTLYKVRYNVYSKFYSKNPINATESTANLKAYDGGISMVLGRNISGTFNDGFTVNNNVEKFDKI
jgi:hypothetical protein